MLPQQQKRWGEQIPTKIRFVNHTSKSSQHNQAGQSNHTQSYHRITHPARRPRRRRATSRARLTARPACGSDPIQHIRRVDGRTHTVKVDQRKHRRGAPLRVALVRLKRQRARHGGVIAVGGGDGVHVGQHGAGGDGFVEEVVHEREVARGDGRVGVGERGGAVEGAVEVGEGGDFVSGFKDVVPFIEEVRVGCGGVDGGDEGDEALAVVDHCLQRGPVGGGGGGGRCVAISGDVGRCEGLAKDGDILVVAVYEDQGDNLVRVVVHPVLDFLEPRFQCTCIEELTRGVAESEGAVFIVDLCGQKTDSR